MTYEKVLAAVADDTRRAILGLIRERPRSVGELADVVPVSQPAVSQHLRVLREAGLVDARKVGRKRIYRLRVEGLASLRAWVESFWEDALEAFRASFDRSEREGEAKPPRGR